MTGRGDGPAGAAGGPTRHVPVLLAEVCEALDAARGGVFVDGTFGAGGYTAPSSIPILQNGSSPSTAIPTPSRRAPPLVAAGREPARAGARAGSAISTGSRRRARGGRRRRARHRRIVDAARRGRARILLRATTARSTCAWRREGPSAADLVNGAPEAELADIFYHYGEERRARAVARAIIERAPGAARDDARARRSGRRADPPGAGRHPSGDAGLPGAADRRQRRARRTRARAPRGRADPAPRRAPRGGDVPLARGPHREAVLRGRSGRAGGSSRHLPAAAASAPPSFEPVTRGPIGPGRGRDARNPRAAPRSSAPASARRRPRRPIERAHDAGRAAAHRGEEEAADDQLLHFVAISALIGSAGYAYSIKYETLYHAEQVVKLKGKVQRERDAIAVLRAEWAHLNRPDRLCRPRSSAISTSSR